MDKVALIFNFFRFQSLASATDDSNESENVTFKGKKVMVCLKCINSYNLFLLYLRNPYLEFSHLL